VRERRLTRKAIAAARQSAAGTAAFLAGMVVLGAAVLVAGTSVPACAGSCPAGTVQLRPQAYAKFASPAVGLRFARGLFAGVALPPGARPVTGPPELRTPPGWGLAPSSDVGQVWRVPLPAADVGWFFAAHPPRGTMLASLGASLGARSGGTVSAVTVSAMYYEAAAVPAALTGGQVVIVVDPAGASQTFIRVDAQAVL
jgi:hypothetical protein